MWLYSDKKLVHKSAGGGVHYGPSPKAKYDRGLGEKEFAGVKRCGDSCSKDVSITNGGDDCSKHMHLSSLKLAGVALAIPPVEIPPVEIPLLEIPPLLGGWYHTTIGGIILPLVLSPLVIPPLAIQPLVIPIPSLVI